MNCANRLCLSFNLSLRVHRTKQIKQETIRNCNNMPSRARRHEIKACVCNYLHIYAFIFYLRPNSTIYLLEEFFFCARAFRLFIVYDNLRAWKIETRRVYF